MSGFLYRLVARTIGQANVVLPRPFPRFAGALDLPIDSSDAVDSPDAVDTPYAAPKANGAEVERIAGKTMLRGRTVAERERARDEAPPAIEGVAGQTRVERPSPAASLTEAPIASPQEGDAGDVSAREIFPRETSVREELRADLERVFTREAAAPIAGEDTPAPRTLSPVTAREDTAKRFPEANRTAARNRGVDPPPAVDTTQRRARTDELRVAHAGQSRAPRRFDPDARIDVALSREMVDPSPLAPMLAGPRTDVRESQAIGSRTPPDRLRFDTASEPEATIVNVSIGRIEVRSPAEPPARTFRREVPAAPQPREELDAYLRSRSDSKR